MLKGEALRGKKEVFAGCMLQYKRLVGSRRLMNNVGLDSISRLSKSKPAASKVVLLFQILHGFGIVLFLMSCWIRQTWGRNHKKAKTLRRSQTQ